MDINKIFSTFEKSEKKEEEPNLKDHPFVISGMIYRTIIGMEQYISGAYQIAFKKKPKLNDQHFQDYHKLSEERLLNNCYDKLLLLDMEDDYIKKHIYRHPQNEFEQSLNVILKYFELKEDFDKCITIQKFITLFRKFLKKDLAS